MLVFWYACKSSFTLIPWGTHPVLRQLQLPGAGTVGSGSLSAALQQDSDGCWGCTWSLGGTGEKETPCLIQQSCVPSWQLSDQAWFPGLLCDDFVSFLPQTISSFSPSFTVSPGYSLSLSSSSPDPQCLILRCTPLFFFPGATKWPSVLHSTVPSVHTGPHLFLPSLPFQTCQ